MAIFDPKTGERLDPDPEIMARFDSKTGERLDPEPKHETKPEEREKPVHKADQHPSKGRQ